MNSAQRCRFGARVRQFALVFCLLSLFPVAVLASGTIEGTVSRDDGSAVEGVTIVLNEEGRTAITDHSGRFRFDDVASGTYSITLTQGGSAETETGVEVVDGQRTAVTQVVDWPIVYAETVTVYSASRRVERLIDAPAAVTIVSQETIQREAASGQVPRLLVGAPGVDMTQSGLYDFNFNTRGFNSTLNRRVLTRLDGRDMAVGVLGAQNWASFPFGLDELDSVELVRGPVSAVYGANAYNGVLDMRTKEPRSSLGGKLRLTGGELDTRRVDARHAGQAGDSWAYRVHGSYALSEDFAVSRNEGGEYAPDELPGEVVPLQHDEVEIYFGGGRIDKYFTGGSQLTVDAAVTDERGQILMGGVGRAQVDSSNRSFVRANYSMDRWNLSTYYDILRSDLTLLSSGTRFTNDSERFHAELQGRWDLAGGRARLVGGGSFRYDNVNSANEDGVQTLILDERDASQGSVFGQVDVDATDDLKLIFSARGDFSTLHDSQFTPRVGAVYSLAPTHSIRATYGRGFQSPNFAEYFLGVNAAPPVDLSALEAALAPVLGGVELGFGSVPILGLGNEDLEVEKIESFEVGYSGVLGGRLVVNLDYYRNDLENFVTDLLSNVGTSLGRINPVYGAYVPPDELSEGQAAAVLGGLSAALPPSLFALMSNSLEGAPIFAAASYTNFGEVTTQGVDLGLRFFVNDAWSASFTYSWFDFDPKVELEGDPLVANSPENRVSVGLTYAAHGLSAGAHYRWVEEFLWASGAFAGAVPSYEVVDFDASYGFGKATVGVHVANLLDEEHYELFGGDILTRRALGFVGFAW